MDAKVREACICFVGALGWIGLAVSDAPVGYARYVAIALVMVALWRLGLRAKARWLPESLVLQIYVKREAPSVP